MGDEELNPYIPLSGRRTEFAKVTGDNLQADVETSSLYEETSEKFDIYHLNVSHRSLTWGIFQKVSENILIPIISLR